VGCYHIEIMRDEQGPCLIEVNGRMIGAIAPRLYKWVTDIDPYKVLIRLHLGEKIDINESVIKGAVTSVAIGDRVKGVVSKDFSNEKLDQLLARYVI
jgi:biotin carboxylase